MSNLDEIEQMLRAAGRIAETARLARKSLTYHERLLLLEVRGKALRANYTREAIEALIEEGKRTTSSTPI